MLRAVIKAAAMRALAIGGAFPTRATDASDLRALLTRLHPVQADQPLIRLGPEGDGGYLVPDDLTGVAACFSPGVNLESGFELDCAERGMRVFLADRSVAGPALPHPQFQFTAKFLGATCDDAFMTLDAWVEAMHPSPADLLLQIDIEGFEYEVLLAASERLLRRFRIVVAEFHAIDQLWSRPFFNLASRAFDKLLQTHACVHIHPNNCAPPLRRSGLQLPPMAEFTFVRRDRLQQPRPATTFPHPLDRDNTSNRHYALPRCWYGG